MELKIGDYNIKTLDKYNFILTHKRPPKGSVNGKKSEKEFIEDELGYYSTLSGAVIKTLNHGLLSKEDKYTAESLKKALTTFEERVKEAYSIKPKDTL